MIGIYFYHSFLEIWWSEDPMKVYGKLICPKKAVLSLFSLDDCQAKCEAQSTCTAFQNDLRFGGSGYCILCQECYIQYCGYEKENKGLSYRTYFKPGN